MKSKSSPAVKIHAIVFEGFPVLSAIIGGETVPLTLTAYGAVTSHGKYAFALGYVGMLHGRLARLLSISLDHRHDRPLYVELVSSGRRKWVDARQFTRDSLTYKLTATHRG
jgi:hypothetical protein